MVRFAIFHSQPTHAHASGFPQQWREISPSEQKSLAINRLLVIKPLGLKQAPIVICYDMKEEPDVSRARALRGFDE